FSRVRLHYWYCIGCHRVYECQIKIGGHWLRIYKKDEEYTFDEVKKELNDMYIFLDYTFDKAVESNPDILLKDFLDELEVKCKITNDENSVYVYERSTGRRLYSYQLEESYEYNPERMY
ncbi:MAG TPA: hypothetical protein DEO82_05155, partial [Eubacterium sp.]|nr:hypothetical protein [Eubacterium sp.]